MQAITFTSPQTERKLILEFPSVLLPNRIYKFAYSK